MGYYNTFVVKIWCDDHGKMVRGYVQHVSSREQTYFLTDKSMTDFMECHLTPPPSEPFQSHGTEEMPASLSEYWGDIDGQMFLK